jgi:hypothetical protein
MIPGRSGKSRRTCSEVCASLLAVTLLGSQTAAVQEWTEPPRSQANLEALAKVQVRTYTFTQAENRKMEYGLFVPIGVRR